MCGMKRNCKKISIIIPLYNYYDGILKIVESFQGDDLREIEVIVFDDSDDPVEQLRIQELVAKYDNFITYRHNNVSYGPVFNWNALLDIASADYIVLMHHDEFILSKKFITNAICKIEKLHFDVGIFDCFLMKNGKIFRRHLPILFRFFLWKFFPLYIFRRNFIGPTASLIVRRELCEHFDNNLKWLVDVDWYYRLMLRTHKLACLNDIAICSQIDSKQSITGKIKDELPIILNDEEIYLSRKYKKKLLLLFTNKGFLSKIFCFFESLMWKVLSVFMLSF